MNAIDIILHSKSPAEFILNTCREDQLVDHHKLTEVDMPVAVGVQSPGGGNYHPSETVSEITPLFSFGFKSSIFYSWRLVNQGNA